MCSLKISSKFRNKLPSIWITINKIVAREKPINLGQGFPDYHNKHHVFKSMEDVSKGDIGLHQYTRGHGHLPLVQVLSKLYSPSLNRTIDPLEEIIVSVGAYGALFCSLNAFLESGDEAIIIEPFFDCYESMVETTGATPRFIPYRIGKVANAGDPPMKSSDLVLDEAELRALINNKTKVIIINTPNNPNGRVMNLKELEMIAAICKEFDLICISDEVYEWIVYPQHKHFKIASFPGMWERTITIGSVGKTLNVTGWKLGWSIGPSDLIKGMQLVSQNCVYTCPTPIQEATARSLEIELDLLGTPYSYFSENCIELIAKRDKMVKELVKLGMKPLVPDGGYFIIADFTDLVSEEFKEEAKSLGKALDFHFNDWMITNIKVAGIPNSVFYSKQHQTIGENFIRFCFYKTDETLEAAFKAFHDWKNKAGSTRI